MKQVLALALALLASGCASVPQTAPRERLDPVTAVYMTIMGEPWVYARDAREVGANVRDYLNVGLLQADRAGQFADWLGVIAWSTVDSSTVPGRSRPFAPGRLRLVWGNQTLELEPDPAGRAAVGATRPVFSGPKRVDLRDAWYRLAPAALARLSRGPPDSIELVDAEGGALDFAAWKVDGRPLRAFLEAIGAFDATE